MDIDKTLLIVNPHSGVHSKEGLAEKLVDKLESKGFSVDLKFTERKGHATVLAKDAVKQGYGSVIVCGGDGTVNETARALCGTGVAMGIVPSGSGNGLARHIGIPIDEMMSVDVIAERCIDDCDCGEANGMKFFCTSGVGFDAAVSHRFANENKRGRITYIKNVIEEFGNYQPQRYVITIDGERFEREALIVACCNASQYGNNAFIAPNASLTDGLLDLVVIKSGNALRTLLAGFDVMMGMVPYNDHIEVFRIKEADIEVPIPAIAHVDGEPVEFDGHAHLKCLPGQLRLYVNPKKKGFTPFITPIDLAMRDWGIAIGKLFKKP